MLRYCIGDERLIHAVQLDRHALLHVLEGVEVFLIKGTGVRGDAVVPCPDVAGARKVSRALAQDGLLRPLEDRGLDAERRDRDDDVGLHELMTVDIADDLADAQEAQDPKADQEQRQPDPKQDPLTDGRTARHVLLDLHVWGVLWRDLHRSHFLSLLGWRSLGSIVPVRQADIAAGLDQILSLCGEEPVHEREGLRRGIVRPVGDIEGCHERITSVPDARSIGINAVHRQHLHAFVRDHAGQIPAERIPDPPAEHRQRIARHAHVVLHDVLHHRLAAGALDSGQRVDPAVCAADVLPVRDLAAVDGADLFGREAVHGVFRVDEEDEGLRPDRDERERHAPILRRLHLRRGRARREEEVHIPCDERIEAADRVVVLHDAVSREVLAVVVIVGKDAALVGDGAGRIASVDDGRIDRHERGGSIEDRERIVLIKAEGRLCPCERRLRLEGQELRDIDHLHLARAAEIVGEAARHRDVHPRIDRREEQHDGRDRPSPPHSQISLAMNWMIELCG